VAVTAQPRLVAQPDTLQLQYLGSASLTLSPAESPSMDMSLDVSALDLVLTDEAGATTWAAVLAVSPPSISLRKADGTLAANSRNITVECLRAGVARVQVRGTAGNYASLLYAPVTVECLPGLQFSRRDLGTLSAPDGSTTVLLTPTDIPDERVTVVITSSPPGIVEHPPRVFFEPFLNTQSRSIVLRHSGFPQAATASISVAAYGGIYQGSVAHDALEVAVAPPTMLLPVTAVFVQPTSSSQLPVAFDTRPADPVTVTAVSSDPSVATVNGPLVARDTGGVSFTVTHVGEGFSTISFNLSTGNLTNSTYSTVTVPETVAVTAYGPGFLVSASQVRLAQMTSQTISVGLDTTPESRVVVTVVPSVAGVVTLSPSTLEYDEGGTLVTSLTLTWAAPGEATLEFRSQGGVYHEIVRSARVHVTSLPPLAVAPASVAAIPGGPAGASVRSIIVSWAEPPTGAEFVTGYIVELSQDAGFAAVAATSDVAAADRSVVVAPLVKGECYYYRVKARNEGGVGPPLASASCVRVVEAPSEVSHVSLKAISDTQLLVEWQPPLDSGDSTPTGIPILEYLVEAVVLATGAVHETHRVPSTTLFQTMTVLAGVEYMVRIRSFTALSDSPQPNAATAYLTYDGEVRMYNVPLLLTVSPLALASEVGGSTSFLMTPASAPTVDAFVDVFSSDGNVAATTDTVVFKAGSTTPQSVIVFHNRKGEALITFMARGGNYAGLSAVVAVETLGLGESP